MEVNKQSPQTKAQAAQAESEEREELAEAQMHKLVQAATLQPLVLERRQLPLSAHSRTENRKSMSAQKYWERSIKLRLAVQIKQKTSYEDMRESLSIAQNTKIRMTHDQNGEQDSNEKV